MAKVDYIAILFGGKVIKTVKFNLVMYFIAIHVCLVYMSSLQIKKILRYISTFKNEYNKLFLHSYNTHS